MDGEKQKQNRNKQKNNTILNYSYITYPQR